MGIANLTASVSSAGGQSIVIGLDGKVRPLQTGEQPLPGELVVILSNREDGSEKSAEIQKIDQQGVPTDITQQVDDIIAAIEQGEDPTQVDPDLAPAAGGVLSSSIGVSGTIARDGTESQPSTLFETQAFQQLDLSRTQSLGLLNLVNPEPPIALDDPLGFTLTFGNMTSDLTSGSIGWDNADISATFNGQTIKTQPEYLDRLAVYGTDIPGGPGYQLQYDRQTGESEQVSIKLGQAATQGRFSITNLYAAEGDKAPSGRSNNETGVWVAYLNGMLAASGVFEGIVGGGKQFVDIDTQGNAFDEIVFMAKEYSLGAQGDTTNDSSDYFIAGLEVSSPGHFAGNLNQPITISIADILNNDSDPQGGALSVTQLFDANSNGSARLDGDNIIFQPNTGWSGITQLEYQVTDEEGETDTAFISILVNDMPAVDNFHAVTFAEDILIADDGVDLFKWTDQESASSKSFTVSNFEPGKDKLDLSDLFDDSIQLDDLFASFAVADSNNGSEVALTFDTKDSDTLTINIESYDQLVAFDTQTSDLLLEQLLTNLPD